jgi:hypothetical protein
MCVGLNWAVLVPVHGQHADSHITCTSGVMGVASVALGWGSIHTIPRRWAIVRLRYHTQRRDRTRGESPTLWSSMKLLGTWGDLDHPLTAPGYPSRPIVVVGPAAVGSIDYPDDLELRWTHVCKILYVNYLFSKEL